MPSDAAPLSPLDRARLRKELAGTPFSDVRVLAETASTNADAAPLLGDSLGTTIVAERQTAGVGRTGRTWHAPRFTSLLFTSAIPQAVRGDALWAATFWTALAVARGIERSCGVRVDLKWPNDLLLNGSKVCGILCISRIVGERAWIGCGVGLNVHRPPDAAAIAAIDPPPAFLSDAAQDLDRTALLVAILATFEAEMSLLAHPDRIAERWSKRARIDGTRYRLRIDADGSLVEGIARGLGRDGALRIEPDGAPLREVHFADAHVVRAAASS